MKNNKEEKAEIVEINVDKNIVYSSHDLQKNQKRKNQTIYNPELGELKFFRLIKDKDSSFEFVYQIEYFNNSCFILSSFVFDEVKYINFSNLVNGYLLEEDKNYYLILKYYDHKIFGLEEDSMEYLRFKKMEDNFLNNPYFIENIDHHPFISYKFLIDKKYYNDILLMEKGKFYDINEKNKSLILNFVAPYNGIANKYKIVFYNQTRIEKAKRQKFINEMGIALGYQEEEVNQFINNDSSLIQPLSEELWGNTCFNNQIKKKYYSKV